MAFIDRRGARIDYSVSGSGPAVVLGHSLLCDRSMWDGVIAQLKQSYTLITPDFRGHGASTAPGPLDLWDLADDWLAILDQENIQSASLWGLSTGGFTAMRLALRHPARVDKLVLLDTDAGKENVFNRVKYAAMTTLYQRTGIIPVGTLAKAMFGPTSIAQHRDRIDDFIQRVRSFDPKQIVNTMRAVFERDPIDVTPIKHPTLVATGEHDHALPVSCGRNIAEEIDGARFVVIPDCGHLSAVEQPEHVAGLIDEFMRSGN